MLTKGDPMDMETATGAGGLALLSKFFASMGLTATGFGIGGALAAVVVMCMTPTKSAREWAAALVSTIVSSFGGGAYVIVQYQLLQNVVTLFDVFALIGIVFACGLPGWLIVRAAFVWMEQRKDKDLVELYKEAKKLIP